MVLVLQWGYEKGTDELLDKLMIHTTFNNLVSLSHSLDISIATMNRKIKKLKDDGLLVSHRYRDNNFIWMIGLDALRNYGAWDAYQIAKFRKYVSYGGDEHEFDDYSAEEQENALEGIPIFGSDKDEALEDAGYSKSTRTYWKKVNKILYAEGIPETQELMDYVDKMYEKIV